MSAAEDTQFGVLEADDIDVEGMPPNIYCTVSDEEFRTVEVWFRWWPDDEPEPMSDPFPCRGYEEQTWLEWVTTNVGWSEVLSYGGEWSLYWPVAFLAEHGIAPMQPFSVRFSDFTSRRNRDGEYDEEWGVEVVQVEPWDTTRVCQAWAAWIANDSEGAA